MQSKKKKNHDAMPRQVRSCRCAPFADAASWLEVGEFAIRGHIQASPVRSDIDISVQLSVSVMATTVLTGRLVQRGSAYCREKRSRTT